MSGSNTQTASTTKILELSGFPTHLKTRDIHAVFSKWDEPKGSISLKWVDDQTALIVFNDASVAKMAFINILAQPPAVLMDANDQRAKIKPYEGDANSVIAHVQSRARGRPSGAQSQQAPNRSSTMPSPAQFTNYRDGFDVQPQQYTQAFQASRYQNQSQSFPGVSSYMNKTAALPGLVAPPAQMSAAYSNAISNHRDVVSLNELAGLAKLAESRHNYQSQQQQHQSLGYSHGRGHTDYLSQSPTGMVNPLLQQQFQNFQQQQLLLLQQQQQQQQLQQQQQALHQQQQYHPHTSSLGYGQHPSNVSMHQSQQPRRMSNNNAPRWANSGSRSQSLNMESFVNPIPVPSLQFSAMQSTKAAAAAAALTSATLSQSSVAGSMPLVQPNGDLNPVAAQVLSPPVVHAAAMSPILDNVIPAVNPAGLFTAASYASSNINGSLSPELTSSVAAVRSVDFKPRRGNAAIAIKAPDGSAIQLPVSPSVSNQSDLPK